MPPHLPPEALAFPRAVYIHTPFCHSRCVYCGFYLELTRHGGLAAFEAALQREMTEKLSGWQGQKASITSVYFGGGTPSVLPAGWVETVLRVLSDHAGLATDAEVTFEVNPKDWASSAADYVAAGINRFSLGVQTFDPVELKKLSRRHTVDDIMEAVRAVEASGARTWSLDLMYGIPHQTRESWSATLDATVTVAPPHVSMYGLQVEANTPLPRLVATGAYPIADVDTQADWYELAIDKLAPLGLRPYELSNLSLPGHESRHNMVYWHQAPYWGFGPSAAGWVGGTYTQNVASLSAYLHDPHAPDAPAWTPSLTQYLEQRVIFGLRMADGLNLLDLRPWMPRGDFWAWAGPAFCQYRDEGLLVWDSTTDRLRLSPRGWLVSNTVLSAILHEETMTP